MPKLAVYGHLVFFIYAYDLSERLHVHISNTKSRTGNPAKIWLDTLEVFETGSLTKKEIKTAINLLSTYKEQLAESVRIFAANGKVKPIQMS